MYCVPLYLKAKGGRVRGKGVLCPFRQGHVVRSPTLGPNY
jgi:hypothetical protein